MKKSVAIAKNRVYSLYYTAQLELSTHHFLPRP